ncbi:MAG TPA: cyanophycin synthetase [Solirubrobacterales bacterium]|nr:cyanophycin synthetase [Solirubrobacterales bacterium]
MHQLNALLGMPQHRFASIHVVGTNGKSSTTRMTAALLQGHGLRTGTCVSPHSERWSERVLIGDEEIGPAEFAAAVERAAAAAETLNRRLPEGEVVTQFELATAATFVALAGARVEVAVIEAGLGGRLDATNTIPSRVAVLTSVGLDHTEWLGESEEEIAAEKLAVLRDHSTLVVGRVSDAVRSLAERVAAERGAKLVIAADDPGPDLSLTAPGRFQRRNFALACEAAKAFLGRELDGDVVSAVAASIRLPGRLERVGDEPPVFLDAAHNPDGAAALAEALPGLAAGRPVVACIAVLREKDAAAMVRALAPAVECVVCTEVSIARPALSASELAAQCKEAGIVAEAEPDFAAAVGRGRSLAAERDGILVVAGSHYALAPAREALRSVRGSQRRI